MNTVATTERTPIIQKILNSDRGSFILTSVLVALLIVIPFCNLVIPQGWFIHIPDYWVPLIGKYMCFALLALALDLVWGYCGILSLGHGAFFALGGYAMGMHLMREIGDRGVYGNPLLPDFMVFLNWDQLPWFWYGFDMFWFAMLMVIVVPGVLAFIFGWLAFRSRVTGVYLSIITQALTFALMLAFFRNDMGFGGNNGLTDFKDVLGFDLQAKGTRNVLFVLSVLFLLGAYYVCRFIANSKAGRVLVAIRDAESRTRFMGYRVENYKLFVWVFSAVLAGIAGALYVPQVGIINPGEFSPVNSIEIVVWVAIGGRGTLYGAVVGAVIVNYAKTNFTGSYPDLWPFLLGGMFVISTMYLPKGVVGVINQFRERRDNKEAIALSNSKPTAESSAG